MADRVLVVTAQYPEPVRSGGQVRTAALVRALASRFRVSVVGPSSADFARGAPAALEGCEACVAVPGGGGRSAPLRRLAELGPTLLRGVPPALARYRLRAVERAIATLGGANSFDAVLCEYTAAALYAPRRRGRRPLTVLDEIDVSWIPVARRAAASHGLARAVAGLEASWTRRYEERLFRAFDVVLAASETDATRVRAASPVTTVWEVPNGVALEGVPERPIADRPPAFVFLGGTAHPPNRDAIAWLVSEILPRLRARIPSAELRLIGEGTDRLSDPHRGVRGLGFAADLALALAPGDVGVAPIRIAGGTRLKLLELMARGVPAVSTTIGAEGLDVTPDEHLVVADDADEIAERAHDLFVRDELRSLLAKRARRLVEDRYDGQQIGARFATRLGRALEARRASGWRVAGSHGLRGGPTS